MDGTLTPAGDTGALLWSGAEQELHSFFPFDPYALPLSSPFVQSIYRDWAMVAIDDEEDDDDEGEEDEDNDDDAAGDPSQDPTAALGASFGGMSISPARTRLSLGRAGP